MDQNLSRAINLYFPAILITIAGLVTIFSIKPDVATAQLVSFTFAMVASLFINRLRLDRGWIKAWIILAMVIFILLLTTIFGAATRGSTRWLSLFGQQLQTSELAKVGLILFSATWFSTKTAKSWSNIFRYLLFMLIPAFIIYRQPDLGTALMIGAIAGTSLLVVGTSLKNLLILSIIFAFLAPLGINQLKPYQRDRLSTFFNPENDPLGTGYNAAQATIAVGSGQIIGQGLGQGTQSHLRFLPERHTDFIFASFTEELGFIGGLVVVLLYVWLIFSLLSIASKTDSTVHSLICLLTGSLIFIQVVINMGMNMGIMPITGITLPFMSYGGSSLLSMYLLIGLSTGTQTSSQTSSRLFHIR